MPVRAAHTEISTRRRAHSGVVHEMAELGVDYLCGRTAEEPFAWTDDPVTCKSCLRKLVAGKTEVG